MVPLNIDDVLAIEGGETSLDELKERLRQVEVELGARLKLGGNPRRRLVQLARAGKLVEDETTTRWMELYNAYTEWMRYDEPVPIDLLHRPDLLVDATNRAAESAALFFGRCSWYGSAADVGAVGQVGVRAHVPGRARPAGGHGPR